ncbi:P-loop containing nucleoside triphosphate hydrolase protein [Pyronema omphalodes]|nr:P-loop containing nucleoside triphosphate hydrolase protein [Pyronema omphalodes]
MAQTKPPAARPPPPTVAEILPPPPSYERTSSALPHLIVNADRVRQLASTVLNTHWPGYSFQGLQEDAITWLISGGNALVIFATGSGKSLIYQVTALVFDQLDIACGLAPVKSISVVISPLLALMKEQVLELQNKMIPVGHLSSDLDDTQLENTYQDLEDGKLRILYCSPERLKSYRLTAVMRKLHIRMIAVDEAHCVSEWGNSFRPDYLKIAQWASDINAERVVCLTATAPVDIRSFLMRTFDISRQGVFQMPSARHNLTLRTVTVENKDLKFQMLVQFLEKHKGPAIVYVSWRKTAEDLASRLQEAGLHAEAYHAGLDNKDRQKNQACFLHSSNMIVVATIAFGMGINKSNIRSVIHYNMSASKEAYAQEIGRAGRDHKPAVCQAFITQHDALALENIIRAQTPSYATITQFLNHIFEGYQAAKANEVIEVSMYVLKEQCDIDDNVAAILFSLLEMRLKLLSAISPRFNNFAYRSGALPLTSHSMEAGAAAIMKTQNVQKRWTHVDVNVASELGSATRGEISSLMEQWALDKRIIINTRKNMIDRFRLLQSVPSTQDIHDIAEKLSAWMKEKETIAILRMRDVYTMLTGQACLRSTLADYFDGPDQARSVASAPCNACTACTENASLGGLRQETAKVTIQNEAIDAVMDDVPESDAVILARVALGAEVGRAKKYEGVQSWGSLAGADYYRLVQLIKVRQKEMRLSNQEQSTLGKRKFLP